MYKTIYVIIDNKGNFIRDQHSNRILTYINIKYARNKCKKLKLQNKDNKYKILRYVYEYLRIDEVEF